PPPFHTSASIFYDSNNYKRSGGLQMVHITVANISLTLRVVPLILPPHRDIYCLKKANIWSDISELFIVILHPVNMRR
ncbi:MAG: hypothetical protein KJ936_04465, partial [Proteobacteria bacterium]|nr:hypothetical protein [Pseudomonadota bacterium]